MTRQCTDRAPLLATPPRIANRAGHPLRVLLAAIAVIPAPRALVETPGVFRLDDGAVIEASGGAAAEQVARQFAGRLAAVPGIETVVRSAGRSSSGATRAATPTSSPTPASPPAPGPLRFRLSPNAGTAPEGYRLVVTPSSIELDAGDAAGLLNGSVTLWQLAAGGEPGGAVEVPALSIDDAPRLRWRGLMLDSARHYQSPEFIERFIDWMALHKLNVLHWHLTDDQAWRLEVRRYPRLTGVGAWRVPAGRAARRDLDPATGRPRLYGGYYSQDTVRRMVRYAAERGVTIVPEIEMPGHASAAVAAYPELGVTGSPSSEVPADWGVYATLYNVEDATFTFIENVLSEVIDLFPGRYIHVGGDEAVKDQWRASARVQALMRERGISDEAALQSYFVQRIGRFLAAHGRRLIGWDEILEGGLAPDATVMSWRGVEGAQAAARAGHDAVLATWPTLYFDNRQGGSIREPPGRGRVVRLEDVYRFDTEVDGLSPEERQHLIGVQGNIWTEHVRTEERVEWMTWPRAAAVAEIGWSPLERLDYPDFRRRVETATVWYRRTGLRYATTEFEPAPVSAPNARSSQELESCADKLVLNLEDDGPVAGPRARFLVDIMNPCWLWRGADLGRVVALDAQVGQFPFNFQIGKDRESIRLKPPDSDAGELEVRVDGCDGELLAKLPLAPALDADGVTRLPPAKITPRPGAHDLCFTFTGRDIDPMWAIDRVALREEAAAGGEAVRVR